MKSIFGSLPDLDTEDDDLEEHQKEREEIQSLRDRHATVQNDLLDKIEEYFQEEFRDGSITSMPSTEKLVEIQEGWEQRRIYENGRFDTWLRESKPGAHLPPHEHPDHDRFIVLIEGKMTVTVGPGSENPKTITLSDKDEDEDRRVLHLPPGKEVCAESIEDSVTVQVFHPPVAVEEID